MTTDVYVESLTDKSFIMSSYNGLKQTLDKYVSENYEEVRAYANYFLTRYVNSKKLACSMLNADTCINNAYLHVLTIDNAKTDENSVKSYLLNTIKYQIIWNYTNVSGSRSLLIYNYETKKWCTADTDVDYLSTQPLLNYLPENTQD